VSAIVLQEGYINIRGEKSLFFRYAFINAGDALNAAIGTVDMKWFPLFAKKTPIIVAISRYSTRAYFGNWLNFFDFNPMSGIAGMCLEFFVQILRAPVLSDLVYSIDRTGRYALSTRRRYIGQHKSRKNGKNEKTGLHDNEFLFSIRKH